MAKNKPEVWCDITCSKCGCLASGSGYYYKGIISKLRNNTKNWIVDEGMNNICPECQKELNIDEK